MITRPFSLFNSSNKEVIIIQVAMLLLLLESMFILFFMKEIVLLQKTQLPKSIYINFILRISQGFAERKLIMTADILELIQNLHQNLQEEKKLRTEKRHNQRAIECFPFLLFSSLSSLSLMQFYCSCRSLMKGEPAVGRAKKTLWVSKKFFVSFKFQRRTKLFLALGYS